MPMMTQDETQEALTGTMLVFFQAETVQERCGAAMSIIRAAAHALDPESLEGTIRQGKQREALGCFSEHPQDWMKWLDAWPQQRAILQAMLNLHHVETELREKLEPKDA